MQGRAAIISGSGIAANGGDLLPIGFAIAERFARADIAVLVVDWDPDAGRNAVALIREAGGCAEFCEADIASIADCDRAAAAAIAAFGRLDILVNNAALTSRMPAHAMTGEEWNRVIDVNLKGAMFLCRAALPHLLAQGGGSILNIASAAGLRSFGNPAYAASKAGLIGLTVDLAGSYGAGGIRVNAIVPGTVETPMARRFGGVADPAARRALTALGTDGYAADVAEAALFLCSDTARWITGITLPVDGGMLALPPRIVREGLPAQG